MSSGQTPESYQHTLTEKTNKIEQLCNDIIQKLDEKKRSQERFFLIGQDLYLYYKFQNAIEDLKTPPNEPKTTTTTTLTKTFFFITNKQHIFPLPPKKIKENCLHLDREIESCDLKGSSYHKIQPYTHLPVIEINHQSRRLTSTNKKYKNRCHHRSMEKYRKKLTKQIETQIKKLPQTPEMWLAGAEALATQFRFLEIRYFLETSFWLRPIQRIKPVKIKINTQLDRSSYINFVVTFFFYPFVFIDKGTTPFKLLTTYTDYRKSSNKFFFSSKSSSGKKFPINVFFYFSFVKK